MYYFLYRTFAKEQYFDSAGLFITVVYSGPILLNCFVLTVSTGINYLLIKLFNSQVIQSNKSPFKEMPIQLTKIFKKHPFFEQAPSTPCFYRRVIIFVGFSHSFHTFVQFVNTVLKK